MGVMVVVCEEKWTDISNRCPHLEIDFDVGRASFVGAEWFTECVAVRAVEEVYRCHVAPWPNSLRL